MVSREGLIVQGARRVATVATLSLEDVDDIIATRTLIECGAVDLLRRPAPRARPAARGARRACVRAPETNWQAVIDADRAFHTTLVGLAGSPRLDAAYAQLDAEIRRTMPSRPARTRTSDDLQAEHADILDALERRAYGQAKALLRGHFAVDAATLGQVLRGDAAPPHTPTRRVREGADADVTDGSVPAATSVGRPDITQRRGERAASELLRRARGRSPSSAASRTATTGSTLRGAALVLKVANPAWSAARARGARARRSTHLAAAGLDVPEPRRGARRIARSPGSRRAASGSRCVSSPISRARR